MYMCVWGYSVLICVLSQESDLSCICVFEVLSQESDLSCICVFEVYRRVTCHVYVCLKCIVSGE